MKILVVGCSWGCGEWDQTGHTLLHGGLAQYLREDDHEVDNFSYGGLSNLDSVNRIRHLYTRKSIRHHDMILVFQTEYCRDHKHDAMQQCWGSNDWFQLQRVQDLSDRWLARFYQRLSEMSQQYAVPIKIIGGCGDGIKFDDMSKDYPGCNMVCQSVTNLVTTGDPNIEDPVLSWYTNKSLELVQRLRDILPSSELPELLRLIHQGVQRESVCREYPVAFWPDGIHLNRHGHRILFDHLKSQKLFD